MGEAAGPVYEVQGYGADLTDERWALVAPLLPDKTTRGEPRRHHRRLVVEAILSVLDKWGHVARPARGVPADVDGRRRRRAVARRRDLAAGARRAARPGAGGAR